MKRLLSLLAVCFSFASCAHHRDGSSVWSPGTIAVFWGLVAAGLGFFIYSYANRNKGTLDTRNEAGGSYQTGLKVKWLFTWATFFGTVILLGALYFAWDQIYNR